MQMSQRGDIASSEAQAEAARLAEEQADPRALSTKIPATGSAGRRAIASRVGVRRSWAVRPRSLNGLVTVRSYARERSERVPIRGLGETVTADGHRVLALRIVTPAC